MFLQEKSEAAVVRTAAETFGGYCHREVIQLGQWWDMENLAGHKYPSLTTRRAADRHAAAADGHGERRGGDEQHRLLLRPGRACLDRHAGEAAHRRADAAAAASEVRRICW